MKKIASLLTAFALTLVFVGSVSARNANAEDRPVRSELPQTQTRANEAREKAEDRVDKLKQKTEERKLVIKQEVCQRKQDKLQKVVPRLANGATSVKSSIDKVYERVAGFYEKGQLTVSNYDELDANVAAAKADAEVSLEAIASYNLEVDCENPNLGQQLDAYRSTIKDAKESLKAYRKALVELISSMRAAAADKSTTEEPAKPEDNNAGQTEGRTNQ